jgi:tetratricopeptide (TPR) repeat protein
MRRSPIPVTVAFLIMTAGMPPSCTAPDKPGSRRAGGSQGPGGDLTEEQRSNLKRHRMLRRLAVRLLQQKRFGAALDKVGRALLLAGQIHGPTHPLGAQTVALRGRIYTAMGRHDLATDSYRVELKLWRKGLDPGNNVVVADCLHRLGVSLHRAGKAVEGLKTLSKAVAMKRATLDAGPGRLGKHNRDQTRPPPKPSLAASLHALARIHWTLKAHAKAVALFREALAIRRKQPSGKDRVQSLTDLATCYEALGRYNLAAGLLGEVVIQIRGGGQATATSLPRALKRQADMSLRAGRTAQAEKQYKEAQNLARNLAGTLPNAPLFGAELDSRMGILYARTNRAALAQSLLRRGLAVFQKDLKANAEPAVRCLVQLAKLQRTGRQLGQATKTIRRALNVVRKHLGHRTYSYARALAELGEVYAAQQAREQAARIMGRAFEIVLTLYGAKNPRTRRLRARLVNLYSALGWKDKLRELPR